MAGFAVSTYTDCRTCNAATEKLAWSSQHKRVNTDPTYKCTDILTSKPRTKSSSTATYLLKV